MFTISGSRLPALSLVLALGALAQQASALPPPPEYVELTPETMKKLGIEYRIHRKGATSSIQLDYPSLVRGKLRPRYTWVDMHDRQGTRLQHSRAYANETGGSIYHLFDHRHVDLSIRVEYGEPYVYASTEYGIKSVSAFIAKYLQPSDLLPAPVTEYKP